MQDVDPKVSIDYMFFTRTFFSAILFAANARVTVTVINKPSGTLATIIPIIKTIFLMIS
jgi:hypothetical protein